MATAAMAKGPSRTRMLRSEVNAPNAKGQVPVAGATFKGFSDVVEVLISAGANPDLGTPTARETARMFERSDLLALFDHTD